MAGTTWYVIAGGKEQGPFSGTQLKELAAQGKLKPTMQIRKDGMEKAVPATAVKGLFPAPGGSTTTLMATPAKGQPTVAATPADDQPVAAAAPGPAAAPAREPATAPPAAAQAPAAEAAAEAAPAAGAPARAPVARRFGRPGSATAPTQKMDALPAEAADGEEGNPYSAPREDSAAGAAGGAAAPADLGRRIGAYVIDSVLVSSVIAAMWVVVIVMSMGAMIGAGAAAGPAGTSQAQETAAGVAGLAFLAALLMSAVLPLLYFSVLEAWKGATFGKIMLGLSVVDRQGRAITAGQAWLRNLVRCGLLIVPGGGLVDAIIALVRPTRESLHDQAAKTVVIRGKPTVSRSSASRPAARARAGTASGARRGTGSGVRPGAAAKPGTGPTRRPTGRLRR